MSVGVSQSIYRPPETPRKSKPVSAWSYYGGEFLAFFFLLILLGIFVVAL